MILSSRPVPIHRLPELSKTAAQGIARGTLNLVDRARGMHACMLFHTECRRILILNYEHLSIT